MVTSLWWHSTENRYVVSVMRGHHLTWHRLPRSIVQRSEAEAVYDRIVAEAAA